MNEGAREEYPKIAVKALVINGKNEILLLRQKKRGGKYGCPGGGTKAGASFRESLSGHVKEQTGLDIGNIDLVDAAAASGREHEEEISALLYFAAKAENTRNLNISGSGKAVWKTPEKWLLNKDVLASKSLAKAIRKASENQKDYKELYIRALADYHNLQKRVQEEKNDFVKYANEKLIMEIIPVFDNLKISLEHIDDAARQNGWAEGIKYVVKQFADILGDLGLEEIEAKDRKFDPGRMEAVEGRGDKVIKVVKPGYSLNGKVIIASRVILGEKDKKEKSRQDAR